MCLSSQHLYVYVFVTLQEFVSKLQEVEVKLLKNYLKVSFLYSVVAWNTQVYKSLHVNDSIFLFPSCIGSVYRCKNNIAVSM